MTAHSKDEGLSPCPFCGGEADMEEIRAGAHTSWSVGCRSMEGPDECIGQQSLLTFARKTDAISAWNRRSSSSADRGMREALEAFQTWWNESLPRALMDAGITGTVVGPKTQAMLDAITAALSARAGEGDEQATRGEDAATASTDRLQSKE